MISNKMTDYVLINLTGSFLFFQAGCLVLDEEHCLANGGDLACPGQLCLIETGQRAETRTDDFGCTYQSDDYEYHLHLKYGLPVAVGITEADNNLDTVEGILVALRDKYDSGGSCLLDDIELQDEYDEIVRRHSEVYVMRARMEKQGMILTAPARTKLEEVRIVEEYNRAISAWLDACRAKVSSEMQ